MTGLPPQLERFADVLADATREDLARGRRRRRAALAACVAVPAATIVLALGLSGGGPAIDRAQAAAILRDAAAIIAPPPADGRIEHQVYEARGWGTPQHRFDLRSERWQRGCAIRVVYHDIPAGVDGAEEASGADGTPSLYDPRRDRVVLAPRELAHCPSGDSDSWFFLKALGQQLERGEYDVAGEGRYLGRATYRLHRVGEPDTHYLEIDAVTQVPLRLVQPPGFYSNEGVEYVWPLWERLDATPPSLDLLDLRRAHPSAPVESVDADAYWRLRAELFGGG